MILSKLRERWRTRKALQAIVAANGGGHVDLLAPKVNIQWKHLRGWGGWEGHVSRNVRDPKAYHVRIAPKRGIIFMEREIREEPDDVAARYARFAREPDHA